MTARKLQGRPIGSRVLEAMEILERIGAASYKQVMPEMAEVDESSNVSKYLRRAVSYGLAEMLPDTMPVKYQVVANWREVLTQPRPPRKSRQKEAQQQPLKLPQGLNSVWGLAQA